MNLENFFLFTNESKGNQKKDKNKCPFLKNEKKFLEKSFCEHKNF